ncbi:MAG: hypothetical protein IPL52_14240 [Flavobacteriales bacterium]|nr:hypothetical protein [Flavobacteriales bacterium]
MRLNTLVASVLFTGTVFANHLPGGTITYRCTGNNMYEVSLQLWRECTGVAMIPQALTFTSDCGVEFTLNDIPLISQQEVSPVCPGQQDQTTCNGGSLIGIEIYTYRTTLFISPCSGWKIAWNTCCRNPSLNLTGTQGIYVEAELNNADGACLISPVFSELQPPFVCLNQPVSYDLGTITEPGVSMRFHFIEARRLTGTQPIVIEPVVYQAPYTGSEPFLGMVLDSLTGNISFTPTVQGYLVCVVQVSMYNANGDFTGTIMRDFPFVIQACTNTVPDVASGTVGNASGGSAATGPYALTVCAASSFCFDITVTDADAAQVLSLNSNVSDVFPGASFNVSGSNPAVASICWNSTGAAAGAYNFTVTAVDDACPTTGSQTYTYTVTLVPGAFGAGADSSVVSCAGTPFDLSTLLTGVPGGDWSDGPIVSQAGLYTYVIGSSCGNDTAYFTVVTDTDPSAGADASADVCQGATLDLTDLVSGDTGGVWSNGAPVVSQPGVYTYTVSNTCGMDAASFSIAQLPLPNAGPDNVGAICAGSSIDLNTLLFGEGGGSWDAGPVVSDAGTYTYTVVNGCGPDQAQVTIIVVEQPDAGIDNAISYCLTADPFAMIDSLLGTPDAGGNWLAPDGSSHSGIFDASVDTAGTYCYKIPGSPCLSVTACLTLTALPDTDPYCIWLGASAIHRPEMRVMPNPSNGALRIEGPGRPCLRAEVLDLQGRALWSHAPNAINFAFELPANMADGSYILRLVHADGASSIHRFQLQH